jgi:hypothetical protein
MIRQVLNNLLSNDTKYLRPVMPGEKENRLKSGRFS